MGKKVLDEVTHVRFYLLHTLKNRLLDMYKLKKEISELSLETIASEIFICLKQRIHISVAQLKKKRRIQWFVSYVAVACLILVTVGSFYYNYTHTEKEELLLKNIIVGENLKEKDIYLITEITTASFTKGVVVQIDENGKATVQETRGKESTIPEVETMKMNKIGRYLMGNGHNLNLPMVRKFGLIQDLYWNFLPYLLEKHEISI
jgi:hypothetical protein